MSSWIAVGKKCVCINDNWWSPLRTPPRVPMLGEVLTVAGVETKDGAIYLTFEEIPRRQAAAGIVADVAFLASSFRPLVSQDDDVALFAHLLNSNRIEEHA